MAGVLSCAVAAPHIDQGEHDGIAAALTVDDRNVRVDWRFFRPLPKPLREVSATLNGRKLGTPALEPYPAEGQGTAIIALLDIGDPSRAEQIETLKKDELVLALRKSDRDLLGFAVYGLSTQLLCQTERAPKKSPICSWTFRHRSKRAICLAPSFRRSARSNNGRETGVPSLFSPTGTMTVRSP